MNHTPGPWFQGFSDGRRVVDGNGASVAWTYTARNGRPHSEVKANARLISAAPELLEACYGAESVLSQNGFVGGDVLDAIRTAIAKAEGRTQ